MDTNSEIPKNLAIRQAMDAGRGGFHSPISAEEFESGLVTGQGDGSLVAHMAHLLRNDNASILQDLVQAGVCSFRDIARAFRNWAPEEKSLMAWAEEMACAEELENEGM